MPRKRKSGRSENAKSLGRQLAAFCSDLFKKRRRSQLVTCAECKKKLKIFHNGSKQYVQLVGAIAIDHACIHFAMPMFSCRLCDYKANLQSTIKRHLNTEHQRKTSTELYDDCSGQYLEEIERMMTHCFGNSKDTAKSGIQKVKDEHEQEKAEAEKLLTAKRQLLKFCHALRQRHRSKGMVQCALCKADFKVVQRSKTDQFSTESIISHAHFHLQKPVFGCRYCDHTTALLADMCSHLRDNHKMGSAEKFYKNMTAMYVEEIKSILIACFDQGSSRSRKSATGNKADKVLLEICQKRQLEKFCADLFKDRDRNEIVACAICDAKLKGIFRSGTKHLVGSIAVDHARFHLHKKMFTCRDCGYAATTRNAVWTHLRVMHNKGALMEHYEDKSTGFLDDIKDMLMQCFGKAQNPSSTTKPDEVDPEMVYKIASEQMSNFCLDLMKDRDRDKPVICSECGATLNVFGGKKGVRNNKIVIYHACRHLGKDLFHCRHCDYKTMAKGTIQKHLWSAHNKMSGTHENYDDLSPSVVDEVKAMLTKCFGNAKISSVTQIHFKDSDTGVIKTSAITLLQNFCKTLFENCDPARKVVCAKCNIGLKIIQGTKIAAKRVIDHAALHMKKRLFLFSCRHCGDKFCSRGSIYQHMMRNHGLNGNTQNFIDYTGEHYQELVDAITSCFGEAKQSQAEEETPVVGKRRGMKRMFVNMHGSVSRFCCRFLADKDESKPLICSECAHVARCFNNVGHKITSPVIEHACIHLGKPLFACKLCKHRALCKGSMQRHLVNKHHVRGSTKQHFDDMSAEHADEIIQMITRCFGEKRARSRRGTKSKDLIS